MTQYGLTEREKSTNLQAYNHALFQNSMAFLDMVCEINIRTGTIVVMASREEPERNQTEYPYESALAGYAAKRIPEGDLETFMAHMAPDHLKALREEETFFSHIRSKDGQWHLHRLVLTPAAEEDEQPGCVYLGTLDLHEEEQRKLEQYRSQEQFREALMSNSYFSFDFDVTAGGMITEEFQARDGTYPIRDATGMTPPLHYSCWVDKWYELYEPQFDQQQVENIFSVDYFMRAFARNERLLDVEVKQKKQDGSGTMEYMHIFVFLLENPADRHIHACTIWRDITAFRSEIFEHKLNLQNTNEELKRTVSRKEQFRLAALSGAMMVYNINLTRNQIEDEFYEIVDGKSYPMLQLVGLTAPADFELFCQRWSETKVPQDSRESFLRMYNRSFFLDAYQQGKYNLEIEFDTVIGRGIPVTLRNTALLSRDAESGDILATVIGRDVTAQRREEHEKREALRSAYEAANRANSAKSDFLARMSHDIRTPMNAIIGMTAIAAAHLDDRERLQDCLNKITSSSRHLLGLINEVLDMSKIESGKIDLQDEAFNLPDLLESLLTMSRPLVKSRRHELAVSIRHIEHERVIGDRQRLQQAFMNLMSNAVKYTPDGGHIRLTISETPTNRPRIGCYEFVFEDDGIGMSESFQERLFNPFERAADERARKEQGTGLGMAITRNIVQMMNGKIEVESALNKGTKITVTVFLKLPEADEDIRYEHFASLPVLVVDDDETAGEAACAILTELGMRAEWVSSGQEGVNRVAARGAAGDGYYAIILDWRMPDMDGVDTAREIRRRMGEQIPIIIFSAYDWSDIEQEARAAGATAFLSKPLFKSRVAYLLSELMGRHTDVEEKSSLEKLAETNFSGRRALLAEDNDLNAEIAQEVLGAAGLELERVENGKLALEAVERAPDGYYDIIFMDIQMPVMGGYEAVRAIRALDRDYARSVPILAMSANAFAEDVQESLSVGMNDHLAKPLDFDQLEKALCKWLH